MENTKQQLEEVIKKNLPEKKEECPEYPCQKCNGLGYTAEHDLPSSHGEYGECVNCPIQVQCEECQATGMIGFPDDRNLGFNQALSQINTSLIADEVLKVVVEILRGEINTIYNKNYSHFTREYNQTDQFRDKVLKLLSNLSPNKENKNNENI